MSRPHRPESNNPSDIAVWVGSGLDELRDELIGHIDKRHREQLEMFKAAFPDGDLAGHAAAHRDMIRRAEDNRDLRRSIVRNGAWGLLAAGALANWEAVKTALKEWLR